MIHIYHHNDHDGIVAAGVLYNYIVNKGENPGNFILFYMIDYTDLIDISLITNGDSVYFLDYSFSNSHNKEVLLFLNEIPDINVVWIDHHITSVKMDEEFDNTGLYAQNYKTKISGVRSNKYCGAVLTYIFCHHPDFISPDSKLMESEGISDVVENLPMFLKYIDDYDCHKCIYRDTNKFHYGFNIIDPSDNDISTLLDTSDDSKALDIIYKTIMKGEEIFKFLEFDDKNYHIDMYGFEFTLPEDHGGIKCFCINRKGNSIMFGSKYYEYDAVIPFYYVNGQWKYSIFSNNNDIDCEQIAKTYGGGGHKGAAGFTLDYLIFDKKNIESPTDSPNVCTKTDMDRWKKFLDSYGVEYEICNEDRYYKDNRINTKEIHVQGIFSISVISFDEDENFLYMSSEE